MIFLAFHSIRYWVLVLFNPSVNIAIGSSVTWHWPHSGVGRLIPQAKLCQVYVSENKVLLEHSPAQLVYILSVTGFLQPQHSQVVERERPPSSPRQKLSLWGFHRKTTCPWPGTATPHLMFCLFMYLCVSFHVKSSFLWPMPVSYLAFLPLSPWPT